MVISAISGDIAKLAVRTPHGPANPLVLACVRYFCARKVQFSCHGRETREQNTLVRVNQDGKAKVAAFLSLPKNFQVTR